VVDSNITAPHLGVMFGMYSPEVTLNQVLREETGMLDAVHKHESGLNLVFSSLSIGELSGVEIPNLRKNLETLHDKYDIVLLDSAPGLGREAVSVMQACDEIIMITTPYVPSVVDVIKCHDIAKEIGVKASGIIINMAGGKDYELSTEDVEGLVGIDVISTISYEKNVLKSSSKNKLAVLEHPESKLTRQYIGLAAKLVGENYETRSNRWKRFRSIVNRFR
jgi:septum site-determining protein MinD